MSQFINAKIGQRAWKCYEFGTELKSEKNISRKEKRNMFKFGNRTV